MAKQKSVKKKQKGKKQPAEAVLTGKSFSRLSMTSFVGVSLSIIIVSTLFFVLILIPQAKQKTEFQATAYVQTFGNQLDLSIKQLQLSLNGIAKNQNIGQLLANNETETLSEKAMEIKSSLPYAMSVYFFPLNTAKINRDVFPPVSFSALDMIQKAESDIDVSPEVQKFEERLLLSLVKSIKYQGKTTGVIYAIFEFKSISNNVTSFDSTQGYLTLTQTFPNGKSQQILQSGDSQWLNSGYPAAYENRIGNWKTRFYMAPPMEDTKAFLLFYFIAVLLMVLSTVLFISFGLRSIELALRQDSTILLALSEQIAEKDHLRRSLDYKFNTLLFASIGHTIERFLEEVLTNDLHNMTMKPPQNPLTVKTEKPAIPQVDSHGEPLNDEYQDQDENIDTNAYTEPA